MHKEHAPLCFSLLAACTLMSVPAHAQITPGHLVDVVYTWPTPYPVANSTLQTTLTVWDEPAPDTYYYFAHFFSLGPYTGDTNNTTAYFGLQTNGGTERVAIFSLWNAVGASGANCGTFGNEGVGYNCKVDYPWVAGHAYTFTVLRTMGTPLDTWQATVTDKTTGVSTPIGQIMGKHTDLRVSQSWFFYEYYQSIPSCDALAHIGMTFSDIVGESGAVIPSFSPSLGDGIFYENDCGAYINSTVCGNAVYNEGGGDVSRNAGNANNTVCKLPPGTVTKTPTTTGGTTSTGTTTGAGGTTTTAGGTTTAADGTTTAAGGTSTGNSTGGTSLGGVVGTGNGAAKGSTATSAAREDTDSFPGSSSTAGCSSIRASDPFVVMMLALLAMGWRRRAVRGQ